MNRDAKGKPAKRGLSERERQYVEAFLGPAAGNSSKAAAAAGYSAKSAARIGYRLSRKVHVRQAIEERVKGDPKVMSRERLQQWWSEIVAGQGPYADAELGDRLKASQLLGRSHAMFIDSVRHHIETSLAELLAFDAETEE